MRQIKHIQHIQKIFEIPTCFICGDYIESNPLKVTFDDDSAAYVCDSCTKSFCKTFGVDESTLETISL